ncbi:MAG TPA: hypothetical protein VM370_02615 [Candidatus Thermoplasmatota archaeon]|nr:hypothetical protein [Candidatus Thermoplasmatota archaeon]
MRRPLVLALAALLLGPAALGATPDAPERPGLDLAKGGALMRPLEPPGAAPAIDPKLRAHVEGLFESQPGTDDPDCGGEHDAGDTWNGSTPLAPPVDCEGSVSPGDVVDLYAVDLPARARLSADVAGDATLAVCLASPWREIVACEARSAGDAIALSLVTNASGLWRVIVLAYGGEPVEYHLVVAAAAAGAPPADCDAADGADAASEARALVAPLACEGATRLLDDLADWYRLDVGEGGAVRIDLAASVLTYACLFFLEDAVHPIACAVADAEAALPTYAYDPARSGYLLLVLAFSDASYHLDIAPALPQDDCATGADATSSAFHATRLPAPGSCGGALTQADTADVYMAHVPAGLALGVVARFDPTTDGMVCVEPLPTDAFAPASCEIAWAGGSGEARAGAPAGDERDVIVYVVSNGATPYTLETEHHAASAQDDCASGADAQGNVQRGAPASLPLDCDGAIVVEDGDVWDVYRVEATEGPIYAQLANIGMDADLCLVDATWSDAACSDSWGDEDMTSWTGSGTIYVVVVHVDGTGSYHLHVEQQDDCGTGADALWVGARLDAPLVHCQALLDTFAGDSEDAFLVPPPLVPDVVVVRMEPPLARARICVEDEWRASGVRGHCTDATFTRIVVARDPLRPMRVTVEGFSVDPFPYTLVVEDPVAHPPTVPPLL